MKIEKIKCKTRCDVAVCKNHAEYALTKGCIPGGGVHICGECLKELYSEAGKLLTPKSPANFLNGRGGGVDGGEE
ncbi:MAG: hypothetical protein LBC13_01615 [Clostridiales bacterium]|nr:hypothetical protein [Clostridiales bacterium]